MSNAPRDAHGPRLPVLLLNTPTFAIMGADTWIHVEIARALDRSRFDVQVACTKGPPEKPTPMYAAVSSIPDIEILPVNFGVERTGGSLLNKIRETIADLPAIASFIRLAVHVRRRKVPIIHTTTRPRDALACVLMAKLTRKKSLVHMQLGFDDWMGRALRWSLKNADGLVSISEFVTQTLVASGHDPNRIHLAYNIVVFENWNPVADKSAVREELGLPISSPTIITVCRLFEGKGTAELLEAIAVVRQAVPDVRLLVVGRDVTGGQYSRQLDAIIQESDLEENVVFLGQRSDIARLMAASDIFAMPSFEEPFGIVFAEAQAMELPVVALNNGGTREVVEHGRTGLLSEPYDIATLAEHLLRLLQSPDLRTQMGGAGRQRVKDNFTAEHLANEMAKIYEVLAR